MDMYCQDLAKHPFWILNAESQRDTLREEDMYVKGFICSFRGGSFY